jgi:hypothetical protein
MNVRIWWLAIRQLQRRDTEGPDIRFAVVSRLLDDLWRHPKRRAHKRVLLRHRRRKLARDAKIRQLDLSICADEDIRRCPTLALSQRLSRT